MTSYDWFTHAILDNGTQLIAIRPTLSKNHADTIVLTRGTSILLNALLNALANEPEIGWSAARQACLRGFYETIRGGHAIGTDHARRP